VNGKLDDLAVGWEVKPDGVPLHLFGVRDAA
jgi:hypothetical protein